MSDSNPEIAHESEEAKAWLLEFQERVETCGLKEFLIKIACEGYANPAVAPQALEDGLQVIQFEDGHWIFTDERRIEKDGRAFRGIESVHNDEMGLTWFMIYDGQLNNSEAQPAEVYRFLKEALLNPEPNFPIRGPKLFEADSWKYYLDIHHEENNLARFKVVENIEQEGVNVYSAMVFGNASFSNKI